MVNKELSSEIILYLSYCIFFADFKSIFIFFLSPKFSELLNISYFHKKFILPMFH